MCEDINTFAPLACPNMQYFGRNGFYSHSSAWMPAKLISDTHLFLYDMCMICIFQKISFINIDEEICMFDWVKLLWPMMMGTRTATRGRFTDQCYCVY